MPDTRRVPTEMEARILLRETERRMADEATIQTHASARRGPLGRLLGPIVFGGALALLPLLDRSVPFVVWATLAGLVSIATDQTFEIARLNKVTAALARARAPSA